MSKKIGLFFGSFNPVHVGHLIIANHIATHSQLDEVWLVVSPQNPFKKKSTLADDYDRLHLVRTAIDGNPKLKASDVEFGLPQPSYTVDTLAYLKEQYPHYEFSLLMGGDNLLNFHKWKNYELILERHDIYVYVRPKYELGELEHHDKVHILEAPLLDISASYIRNLLKARKPITYLVTKKVEQLIEEDGIYRKLFS